MGNYLPQGAERTWIYRTPIQRLAGPVGPFVPAQPNPDPYHPSLHWRPFTYRPCTNCRQHYREITPKQETAPSDVKEASIAREGFWKRLWQSLRTYLYTS